MFKSTKEIDAIRRRCNDVENELIGELLAGRIARREFLRHGAVLGISAPLAAGLAGCADAPSYPLDLVPGAAAAYSYRKLANVYAGKAANVQRGSDRTLQEIGFNGVHFDAAGFNIFTGGSGGWTAKWYDQSGNGNDQVQSARGQQPIITSFSSPTNYGGVTGGAINQFMSCADSASTQSLWANGGFAAFVYDVTQGGTGPIISKGTSGSGWLIFSYLNGATYQLLLYLKAATTAGFTWVSNAVSTRARHVVTVAWNASSASTPATITLDGVVCGYKSTATPVGSFSDVGGGLECYNDMVIDTNNTALVGSVFEVMLWNRIPSATAQARLVKNMRAYYGV